MQFTGNEDIADGNDGVADSIPPPRQAVATTARGRSTARVALLAAGMIVAAGREGPFNAVAAGIAGNEKGTSLITNR